MIALFREKMDHRRIFTSWRESYSYGNSWGDDYSSNGVTIRKVGTIIPNLTRPKLT